MATMTGQNWLVTIRTKNHGEYAFRAPHVTLEMKQSPIDIRDFNSPYPMYVASSPQHSAIIDVDDYMTSIMELMSYLEPRTAAEKLAVAVLRGDTDAAIALADEVAMTFNKS